MIKRLIRYKIYTDRARWYATYVQSILMVIIWLQTAGVKILWWYYPIILLITVCSFIVIGYIDVKIGLLKEEQKKYAEENPFFQDMLKELKK